MSFDRSEKSIIVFDTNILFENAESRCDFSTFKLNRLFQNIVEEIEERDVVDSFVIAIPEVCWNELFYQRLKAFKVKNKELKGMLNRFSFPNFEYKHIDIDYATYLNEQIKIFQDKLSKYVVSIIDIKLPDHNKFQAIIDRAFSKRPPFEGVDKKSDKGFKDALLWESILEFKAENSQNKIIFYARDGLFNNVLEDEYRDLFSDDIIIIDKESKVIEKIVEVQKKVNKQRNINESEIKYSDELRQIINLELIREAMFDIGVGKQIGAKIYEISDVSNMKIINLVESTDEEILEYITYVILLKVDVTISNYENEDDIELESEDVVLKVNYSFIEKHFYLTHIIVLEEEYEVDNLKIGGEIYV